jgi:CRISPR-associated protein Csb2
VVTVASGDATGTGDASAWVPDPDGDVLVRVPRPGDLAIWDQHHADFLTHGPFVGRLQFGALDHRVRYRSPNADAGADRGAVVSWLRLAEPVSGRRARDVAVLFKAAVLSQHQRIFGEPPATLHGHGFGRESYDLARYLPLPDAGHRRADGRIRGIALWMPPGTTADERRTAAAAARSVRRLNGRGLDIALATAGETPGERPLLALAPGHWEGPARCWATVFPAVHERRVPLDIEEAARWCEHAGLPTPDAVLDSRVPFVHGASDLAPPEVHTSAHAPRRYSHVALRFAQPVRGPVAVGAGRQRGMGLCIPVTDWRPA